MCGRPLEIDGRDGQRLVHRHDEIPGAVDAALVAERLRHGFAERDAEVLDGVMLIDVEIALGLDPQVEAAVAREELQHVIEEPDAGRDVVPAPPVEDERQADLAFRWSADRLPRDAQDLLQHREPRSRVLHDSGRDPDAAGAARFARAVAQVDAACGRVGDDPRRVFAHPDEHEVGVALPVVQRRADRTARRRAPSIRAPAEGSPG